MIITYDRNKNLRNIAERGLSFDLVAEFDFRSALFEIDERRNYMNRESAAWESPGIVFTFLSTRSRRKANSREVKRYESKIEP